MKYYFSKQFLALSPEEQAENKYIDRTGIDPMTNEKLYEPNDDIGPYYGHDYEDEDEGY